MHKRAGWGKRLAVGACSTLLVLSTICVQMPVGRALSMPTQSKEWRVLLLTNKQRMQNNLEPLTVFDLLEEASEKRAQEIAEVFEHSRPDGRKWYTIFDEGDLDNYPYSGVGENIARGQTTPESVVDAWMRSEGHRENILTEEYQHMGAGFYNTGTSFAQHWSQTFMTSHCDITAMVLVPPTQTTFSPGASIDDMGAYLIMECNKHGESFLPVCEEMCSGYDSSLEGQEQTVTVAYGTQRFTFTVTLGGAVSTDAVCNVVFNPTGGETAVYTKTVKLNEVFGTLPVPTRTGYQFSGWYTAKENGEQIQENSQCGSTGSQVLYAHWTEKKDPVSDTPLTGTGTGNTTPGDTNGGNSGSQEENYNNATNTNTNVTLQFADVQKTDWYYQAISTVYQNKIMAGSSNTQFAPLAPVNRAMFATILYRMEKEPTIGFTNQYQDVADGTWYSSAVCWASERSIVNGYGNGLFGAGDLLTRGQLAAMLYRYTEQKGEDVSTQTSLSNFVDADSVANWNQPSMKWAVGAGLLSGTSDHRLNPNGTASRAECATILMRYLHLD